MAVPMHAVLGSWRWCGAWDSIVDCFVFFVLALVVVMHEEMNIDAFASNDHHRVLPAQTVLVVLLESLIV